MGSKWSPMGVKMVPMEVKIVPMGVKIVSTQFNTNMSKKRDFPRERKLNIYKKTSEHF